MDTAIHYALNTLDVYAYLVGWQFSKHLMFMPELSTKRALLDLAWTIGCVSAWKSTGNLTLPLIANLMGTIIIMKIPCREDL